MLLELSAPPGSGKTAVARRLFLRGYLPANASHHDPLWGKVFVAGCILEGMWVFRDACVGRRAFTRGACSRDALSRSLRTLSLAGLSRRAARSANRFVLDQGPFGLGSGLPLDDATIGRQLSELQNRRYRPRVVIFFRLPESLILEKRRRRGDWQEYEEKARRLGFATAEERLTYQYRMLPSLLTVCRTLRIGYAVLSADFKGQIAGVDGWCNPHLPTGKSELDNVVQDALDCWAPGA